MPEVSADFRTFTFRIQPGIYFADDPAFKGKQARADRAGLRLFDQAPLRPALEERQPVLPGKRQDAGPERAAPAGDRREEAVRLRHARSRACGRWTATPSRSGWPTQRRVFSDNLADGSFTGAMAREVVEFYGDKIGEHPVGTGPFRLAQWRRSSRIVLANATRTIAKCSTTRQPPPTMRGCRPSPAQLKGRRLPMIDRSKMAIIEETQPRWLSFLNGERTCWTACRRVRQHRDPQQPARAQPGQARHRHAALAARRRAVTYFNMENPIVGGNTPDEGGAAAGHRAGVRRRSRDPPGAARPGRAGAGADPARHLRLRPGVQERDERLRRGARQGPARPVRLCRPRRRRLARAARRPPLVLEYATQPDQTAPPVELWKKNMDAIGLRIEFKPPSGRRSSRPRAPAS